MRDETFDGVWASFRALAETSGPTENAIEAWRRGRERYAVWALRVLDPTVIARMSAVAARLGDGIVPVASKDAHVTAWVCGFPAARPMLDDDVADAVLDAQRLVVSKLRPPRLTVGGPNAFATCAFLEVHDPRGELAALRAALAAPGAREVRFAAYQPHVTVGRFADTRPAAPIARALAALRESNDFGPHAVRDSRVELIELDARAPDRLTTVWSPEYDFGEWGSPRSRTKRSVSP
jgi:2'-5' RNA ligase